MHSAQILVLLKSTEWNLALSVEVGLHVCVSLVFLVFMQDELVTNYSFVVVLSMQTVNTCSTRLLLKREWVPWLNKIAFIYFIKGINSTYQLNITFCYVVKRPGPQHSGVLCFASVVTLCVLVRESWLKRQEKGSDTKKASWYNYIIYVLMELNFYLIVREVFFFK